MKNVLALLIIAIIILNLSVVGQTDDRKLERQVSTTQTGKWLALVIGNGRYQNISVLDNPVNDANDMAATLQNLGFEVIKGTDADLVQMRRLIREFGEKLEAQKGIGLFFYAGHGVEVRGRNFLIPVDAEIKREVETEDYAIEVNAVLRQMDAANNGFNIVVLDACRNNPFSRGWNRSGETGGLANLNAPTGTYIAYAAAPGTTASDGKGTRNGVFTGALLKNLKRPNLKLEEVFKATREEVMTLTGNKQVPWDSSSIKGDFFFSRTNSDTKQSTVAANNDPNIVAKNAAQQEREAWDLVKNSSDAEGFRYFLKEFPAGANANGAKIRLEELVWQSVKSSTDKARVQSYLNEFPNGANAAAARIKLRQLDSAVSTSTTTTNVAKTAGAVSKRTLAGGVEMNFAYIPAGEFQMGSNNGEKDEQPVHTVKLSRGFEMQTTEVTQAQWKAVMGALPSKCDYGSLSGNFLGDNKPIICMSWDDAQQFIAKLNAQNDGYKYRLPTEAEWEYAARAGTTGDYAGYLDGMGWHKDNSGGSTQNVGTKQANGWGLYDMHGNVWEWVQDWYDRDFYSKSPTTDPVGASSGSYRVFRGGSWSDASDYLRSANRFIHMPSSRHYNLSFRVVRY